MRNFPSRSFLPPAARALLFLFCLLLFAAVMNVVLLAFSLVTRWDPRPLFGSAWFHLGLAAVSSLFIFLICRLFLLFLDGKPLAAIGLGRPVLPSFVQGFALGALLQAALFLLLLSGGWINWEGGAASGSWGLLPALLVLFFFQSSGEELICRGYLLHTLGERGARAAPLLATSLLFAVLHLGNYNVGPVRWIAAVNIALSGLLLGLLVFRQGNLWGAIGLHVAWNFSLGAVFSLPVSGLNIPGLLPVRLPENHVTVTGGAFGPEGGLILTALLVPLVAFLLVSLARPPAEPRA